MFRKLFSLFSPSKPFVSPTQKQIEYAQQCGVDVRPGMDREALSKAIDDAFASDPRLKFKQAARRKRKEKEADAAFDQLPSTLKREFNKWNAASDEHDRFVVVYQHGRDVIVDVLECEAVRIDKMLLSSISSRLALRTLLSVTMANEMFRADELNWDRKLSIRATDIKSPARSTYQKTRLKNTNRPSNAKSNSQIPFENGSPRVSQSARLTREQNRDDTNCWIAATLVLLGLGSTVRIP